MNIGLVLLWCFTQWEFPLSSHVLLVAEKWAGPLKGRALPLCRLQKCSRVGSNLFHGHWLSKETTLPTAPSSPWQKQSTLKSQGSNRRSCLWTRLCTSLCHQELHYLRNHVLLGHRCSFPDAIALLYSPRALLLLWLQMKICLGLLSPTLPTQGEKQGNKTL